MHCLLAGNMLNQFSEPSELQNVQYRSSRTNVDITKFLKLHKFNIFNNNKNAA